MDGIGDTLRVSLTADPVKEVEVAWEILKALRPARARARDDRLSVVRTRQRRVESLAIVVEERLRGIRRPSRSPS